MSKWWCPAGCDWNLFDEDALSLNEHLTDVCSNCGKVLGEHAWSHPHRLIGYARKRCSRFSKDSFKDWALETRRKAGL